VKIVTGLTGHSDRAREGRGCLLMGKTGLICNVFRHELPREALSAVDGRGDNDSNRSTFRFQKS
jgi:hypothetical protein